MTKAASRSQRPISLSETTRTLREIRVAPVKSLGQNFLHDRNLGRWIVAQIEPAKGDYVIEIGPGLGALTQHLLETDVRVLAIEKDARLVEFLRSHFANDRLEVRHGDALDFDVESLFAEPSVKLIGNLPYYVSSQLLLKFLEYPSPISLAVLMLQREMADRLTAMPGSKSYGALTVLLQRRYHIKPLRKVPTAVFTPRPDVESAVIRVTPRKPTELPPYDDALLVSLVKQGFSQRRKQLGNLLQTYVPDWTATAEKLGLERTCRAETLSLKQWIALADHVRPLAPPDPSFEGSESLPVVDDSDHVVGAAPRSKVHGDNLRHRAVHILLFNGNGELFLQKRSRWKDRHPERWDSSAAGHVPATEEYDQAARRELREELGVEAPLERIAKLPASERTGQEFIWLYRTRYDGELSLNRHEIETGHFFQPAIITGWVTARPRDFAPGFLECWKVYQRQLSG